MKNNIIARRAFWGDRFDKHATLIRVGLLDMQKVIDEKIELTQEWNRKAPVTARYMHLFQLESYGVDQRVATHQEALGQLQQMQVDEGAERWETAPLRSLATNPTDPGRAQAKGFGAGGKEQGKGKGKEKGKGK